MAEQAGFVLPLDRPSALAKKGGNENERQITTDARR